MIRKLGKTAAAGFAIALATTAMAAPAEAQTSIFNLTGGSSATTGTAGNSRVFTAETGLTVTAQAWSMNTSTGVATAAYLGSYSAGLGVTNSNENGSYPEHTIDNRNGYDFVTLTFSQAVQMRYAALTPFNVNSGSVPAENNAWVSFTYDPALLPITATSVWSNLMLHSTEVKGNLNAAQNYISNLNPGMNSGNIWIVGADRLNTSSVLDDGFKLSGFNVQIPTPEPSSWALMIGGLGMVGASLRSRRRTVGGMVAA